MRKSLSSNRAGWSSKIDLIIKIQLKRLHRGITIIEVKKSTKGYNKKTVDELKHILKYNGV